MVIKEKDRITFSNPGAFRIGVETAKNGGVSDPRNGALVKMFHLVNIGGGTGSGIPNIYSVWRRQGWAMPVIEEQFAPERITFSLWIGKPGEEMAPKKGSSQTWQVKTAVQKAAIIEYLTDHISATDREIAELLGVEDTQASQILSAMIADETVVREDTPGNQRYKLKA